MQTRDKYDNDNVRRIFEAIAQDTINNSGGTYQHKTGARVDLARQYGSGYVVSVAEYGECLAAPLATLGERIADVWPKHIASNVQYVGTWQHRGLVFVDGSVVLPESARDIALALARKYGQTAIYNIRTASAEMVADSDIDATAEVRALVAELHDALYGDVHRTIVDDALNIDDNATWIVERLRVLTDAEYAECAYGDDDDE